MPQIFIFFFVYSCPAQTRAIKRREKLFFSLSNLWCSLGVDFAWAVYIKLHNQRRLFIFIWIFYFFFFLAFLKFGSVDRSRRKKKRIKLISLRLRQENCLKIRMKLFWKRILDFPGSDFLLRDLIFNGRNDRSSKLQLKHAHNIPHCRTAYRIIKWKIY